jgi:OOP family OmpA-OmpF porin
LASAAASFLIKSISSKLIGEIWISRPVRHDNTRSDRLNSSAESIVGIKHDVTTDLSVHGGAGTELVHGISSPDLRVYAGLNYTLKPSRSAKPTAKKRKTRKPTPAPVEDFKGSDDELVDRPRENPFEGTPEPGVETIVIDDVHFAFDKDNVVLPGTRTILKQLYDYLMKEPRYQHLSIEGHTDYMGSDAYNQDLSERRARTIRRYMIEVHKLPEDTVEAWGFGESRPIADNGNWQGRQENRRVEFKITR